MSLSEIKTDFLVIGSGISGLMFALHAAQNHQVTLITKKELSDCNTNVAQGGLAAVLDPLDLVSSHPYWNTRVYLGSLLDCILSRGIGLIACPSMPAILKSCCA